jgi:hypothetical protein
MVHWLEHGAVHWTECTMVGERKSHHWSLRWSLRLGFRIRFGWSRRRSLRWGFRIRFGWSGRRSLRWSGRRRFGWGKVGVFVRAFVGVLVGDE